MHLELILSFLATSIILSLMPGPDNIYVLTESITKGSKNGISISFGLGLGVLVHTTAAATGLSLIIMKSAMVFTIIKYLGAAYMFYLAYKSIGEKRVKIDIENEKEDASLSVLQLIRKGFLMNILNPKVSLFFIAFLPQFVSSDGYNVTIQMIILGVVFMIQAIIIFSGIAILSSRLTKYVNDSKFWNITKWSKVGVLSILGISLIMADR